MAKYFKDSQFHEVVGAQVKLTSRAEEAEEGGGFKRDDIVKLPDGGYGHVTSVIDGGKFVRVGGRVFASERVSRA